MTVLHAVALGVLQGLTEFLPVSSSGHLVLAEAVTGIHLSSKDLQSINVLLHMGTLLALFIVYADVWIALALAPLKNDTPNIRRLVLLLIATIPGAAVGFFLEDFIALHFQRLLIVGIAFAVTGIVLLLGEREANVQTGVLHRLLHPMKSEPKKLTTRSAFFIGVAQAFALIPGLSRSGLTISAGRMIGLERKDALDFSFLMAVPIIAGASAFSMYKLLAGSLTLPTANITMVAIAMSFISSLGALLFLRTFVIGRSLAWFSPYLFGMSIITIALNCCHNT